MPMVMSAKTVNWLDRAFDLVPAPVFVKDRHGVYRLCNEIFADQILGLPRDRIIGQTLFELDSRIPADLAKKYHEMDLALLAAGGSQTYQAAVRCADDVLRTFEFCKTVVLDDDGQPSGLIGVMLDITARQRTEEQLAASLAEAQRLNDWLRRQQTMLIQTEKLAAIGELAGGVAHEINNPLAVVKSNLTSLVAQLDDLVGSSLRGAGQDQQVDLDFLARDSQEIITDCLDSVGRIQKIVSELLGFAQPDAEQPAEVDLASLIETSLALVDVEATRHCTFTKRCEATPRLVCHPRQIEQALINLLLNAAQATRPSGLIDVILSQAGDQVLIRVRDNGSGIAPHLLDRVFEPFFTTRRQGEGTGLGLHVVQAIMARHGGRVELETTVGKGTTVTLVLPLAVPAPA